MVRTPRLGRGSLSSILSTRTRVKTWILMEVVGLEVAIFNECSDNSAARPR